VYQETWGNLFSSVCGGSFADNVCAALGTMYIASGFMHAIFTLLLILTILNLVSSIGYTRRLYRSDAQDIIRQHDGTGSWARSACCCAGSSLDHPRTATALASTSLVLCFLGIVVYAASISSAMASLVALYSTAYSVSAPVTLRAGFGLLCFLFVLSIVAVALSACVKDFTHALHARLTAGSTDVVVKNPIGAMQAQVMLPQVYTAQQMQQLQQMQQMQMQQMQMQMQPQQQVLFATVQQ
jgi:multisubunit Na+/H+ antiporter MnhG subunit